MKLPGIPINQPSSDFSDRLKAQFAKEMANENPTTINPAVSQPFVNPFANQGFSPAGTLWLSHDGSNYTNSPYSFRDSMSVDAAQAALATLKANPVIAGQSSLKGWDIWGGDSLTVIQGPSGYHFGDVDIDKQPDRPENPGIQSNDVRSSYGDVIPISLGRRRLPGTIIVSSEVIPRLEGNREYDVVYQIPVYEDKANTQMSLIFPDGFFDPLFDPFSLSDDDDKGIGSEEEVKRKTHTVRVFNPSDSEQFVDVEVVDEIAFTEANGVVRHVKLKNT